MRLLLAGIVITCGAPMVGLLFTVVGMISAFNRLGANGVSDPKLLAGDVGQVLTATMCGLIVSAVVGLPLIIAGTIMLLARRKPRNMAG